MPIPIVIGKAIGKAIGDAAVDATKAPRTKPRKTNKSGKAGNLVTFL